MDKKDLEKAFASNNGVLKTSQLAALKIDSTDIKRLIKNGVIEKIKTGYYRFLSDDTSEAAIIAHLDKETFNKAVQAYLADPKKNIKNLLAYAQRRKATKRVHDVIGVWL